MRVADTCWWQSTYLVCASFLLSIPPVATPFEVNVYEPITVPLLLELQMLAAALSCYSDPVFMLEWGGGVGYHFLIQ